MNYGNDNQIPLYVEKVASQVINSAYHIHSEYGPGLLEKAYEFCLFHDLNDHAFFVKSQVSLPIDHHDHKMYGAYRMDMVENDCVVVEVKTVESLQPIHRSQLLTYLKIGGYRLGLLINFSAISLKDGIKRVGYCPGYCD